MEITVLGPLTVNGDGVHGRRDRVVLAVLASRPGRQVPPDTLADAIWGDQPPASAGKNLQGCMVRLRRLLGPDGIATSELGYSLAVAPDDVDAWRFERLVERAREVLELGEPDRASYQLDQALALWMGDPFVDLEGWPGAGPVVRRLVEVRQEAEELKAEADLAAGRIREVLAISHTLVREAPLREQRWALLARAQYQTGQQADALRTIHQLKGVLSRQLGIDPSPDLIALEHAILRQDPDLVVPESTGEQVDSCPWPGLQAYDVDEADWYFGREHEVADCLELLRTRSFLALAGPSGSGKSSLLRAGVGAALRARGQRVVVTTPGARPTDSLSVLGGAPRDAVLVVDQAEEVFTLCTDPDQRRGYLDTLVAEAERRTVLMSIRADRLSEVTTHPGLSRLVERGLYLVGGLDEQALRATIEKPARQAGLLVEPGLVDLLVTAVARDPGALPLLSHALQETWRRREGRTLTVAGYRESGGINGAVAQTAERLYGDLDPDDRDGLRELMLRLVMPDREGEPVPAKVPRRMLAPDSEQQNLAERLVAARLVTSDDEVLSISHEALARAWPRLRGWLEDDVDGQRILHHLAAAADGWDALGRPDTELYRGVRLTRALAWHEQRHASLNPVEADFLEASRKAEELAERSLAEQARQQGVLIRRQRTLLVGAVVLLLLALAAGGYAAVQSERASHNAAEAEQAALSADARRIGTRSQVTDDISLSLLLAVAGARLDDSPETRASLLTAMAEHPRLVRSAPPGSGYLEVISVSPDGRWVAASDDQNRMHLYDATTNQLLGSYDPGRPPDGGQAFLSGVFSPDSKQLAVTQLLWGSTAPVRLLDPHTMHPTTTLDLPGNQSVSGVDVAFSADGRYLAATVQAVDGTTTNLSGVPGYALVWDLSSPSTPPVRVPTEAEVQGVALSPDGRILYTGDPLTAYDLAEGKRIWRRPDITTYYTALDVNAEGTLLAVEHHGPCLRKDALLVDASSGMTVRTLPDQRDPACYVQFSPDGTLVGSVSNRGEFMVWDTATGQLQERWQSINPQGIGFSPDNALVYSAGFDSTVRAWDRSGQDTYLQQTTRLTDAEVFAHADFSPDGRLVAYRWLDETNTGWVRFVDAATGEATAPTELPAQLEPWSFGSWRPDGGRYVAWCFAGADRPGTPCRDKGVVRVLDTTTGKVIDTEDLFDQNINALAYVNGDQHLLVGRKEDQRSSLFDAETLLPEGEEFEFAADWSAPIGDGSTAVVYRDDVVGSSEQFLVVDLNTREVLAEGGLDLYLYASDASPDGSMFVAAGNTGEIVAVDVSTGEVERRSANVGAGVLWLDYSADGELLVSGAANGAVSLWDAASLELLGTVYPPRAGGEVPSGAHFIGDSHDVAIASYDGGVYRWDTDLGRAIDYACRMAGRTLSEDEWATYLPAQPYQDVCPDL